MYTNKINHSIHPTSFILNLTFEKGQECIEQDGQTIAEQLKQHPY